MPVDQPLEAVAAEDPALGELRARARAWFATHTPARRAGDDDAAHEVVAPEAMRLAAAKAFQAALYDAGLAGITWPRAYGGQGLTAREQRVVSEEAARYALPTSFFLIGLGMCGPTIVTHGTDEQQQRYLRPMLRGEEIWCQLFSEPGAGSDVARLATRAVRDGDHWVLNGQKVWTSGAHYSDHGIVLARTDPGVPKHQGITMFIVDMHAAGIEVMPLRDMSGQANFNEVFLVDVHVPASHVLGELHGGWRAAVTTLLNERVAVSGGTAGTGTRAAGLIELARSYGVAEDRIVRQELASVWSAQAILGYLRDRVRAAARTGRAPGPEGSVAKLASSRLAKRAAGLAVSIAGAGALAFDPDDARAARWSRRLCASPGASIGGGTDEVLRTIIGERALGLPKESQEDRDVPYDELIAASPR